MNGLLWEDKFKVGEDYSFGNPLKVHCCIGFASNGFPVFEIFHVGEYSTISRITNSVDLSLAVLKPKPIIHTWYVGLYRDPITNIFKASLPIKNESKILKTHSGWTWIETQTITYIENDT